MNFESFLGKVIPQYDRSRHKRRSEFLCLNIWLIQQGINAESTHTSVCCALLISSTVGNAVSALCPVPRCLIAVLSVSIGNSPSLLSAAALQVSVTSCMYR